MRRHLRVRRLPGLAVALLATLPPAARAQSVQITGLSDLNFGALPTTGADQTQSESVCATSGLLGGRYSVTATGSGSGGGFTLANGSATLPYEVQWASSSGQTSGAALTAGSTLGGQSAALLNCTLNTTASLIVILGGTQIVKATAGSYGGTLTIILSAN